ncbi:hypothetical protein [Persicitalea jodogahamensis]|uniref:hypothetical protein n=1 Tax=Persicitalea jodogahamensis TaxID=402147 RepID=UPI00167A1156|nr:hypothetical protein [Persicitalea jodogahamensis]
MKSLLAASAIVLSTVCFGQTQHEKLNGLKLLKPDLAFQTDTTIQVIYKSKV